jgi:hypothetical protein
VEIVAANIFCNSGSSYLQLRTFTPAGKGVTKFTCRLTASYSTSHHIYPYKKTDTTNIYPIIGGV